MDSCMHFDAFSIHNLKGGYYYVGVENNFLKHHAHADDNVLRLQDNWYFYLEINMLECVATYHCCMVLSQYAFGFHSCMMGKAWIVGVWLVIV
jgi:hypothetical protein